MVRNDIINSNGSINYDAIINKFNQQNTQKNSVNVKDFGAVGNAYYYNKNDNNYYSDSNFTLIPNDDSIAIQNAIDYALNNNIQKVIFPKGYYYLPNKSFIINADQIHFVGEQGSFLVSTGLTNTDFLTIQAPTYDRAYFEASNVIYNLTIIGNYYQNDNTYITNGISGITFSGDWPQHTRFHNVGVSLFNIGMKLVDATEIKFDNISIVLCDCGVYFPTKSNGGYNPIPMEISSSYIELCAIGIHCLSIGYSALHLIGCSIGGNSQAIITGLQVYFIGCRFEFSLSSCCDKNGNPLYPFELDVSQQQGSDSSLVFTDCVFLLADGSNAGRQIYSNKPVYTANSLPNYLIKLNNPYYNQDNILIVKGCKFESTQKYTAIALNAGSVGNIVGYGNMFTWFSSTCLCGLGNSFVKSGNLPLISNNITYDTSSSIHVYKAGSNSAYFSVPVDDSVKIVSVHLEPYGNITLTVGAYCNTTLIGNTFTVTISGDNPKWEKNCSIKIPSEANNIKFTFSGSDYNTSIDADSLIIEKIR